MSLPRHGLRAALGVALGVALTGCHTVEHDTSVPLVEEFHVAPKEARYDQPPEAGYRKPPPKKEFKPSLGGGAGGMGGPG